MISETLFSGTPETPEASIERNNWFSNSGGENFRGHTAVST